MYLVIVLYVKFDMAVKGNLSKRTTTAAFKLTIFIHYKLCLGLFMTAKQVRN